MALRVILLGVLVPGEVLHTHATPVWGQLKVASANVLTLAPEEWRRAPAAAGTGLMAPGKMAKLSADFKKAREEGQRWNRRRNIGQYRRY